MSRNDKFPKAVQLAAQHSERKTGIPACVSLAQWALESAYGKSLSGANNPFGIKGNAQNGKLCPTWEVVNGKSVRVKAYFRNFPSLEAAFDHHGAMLTNPLGYYRHSFDELARYKAARDPAARELASHAYIRAIAKPYATDPLYAEKLIGIVKTWKLHELNLAP